MKDNKGNRNDLSSDQEGSSSYGDIYSELPKEVVDVLMKTHPLITKEGKEKLQRMETENSEEFSKIPTMPSSRGGDVLEVREARMQQVGSEISEIKKTPTIEGEPTRLVTRREVNESLEGINVVLRTPKEVKQMNGEEENEDIQFVSVVPARNKVNEKEATSFPTARVGSASDENLATGIGSGLGGIGIGSGKKKRKKDKEEVSINNERPRYEDIDFEEREKQEQLDNLYDEEYDEYYEEEKMFNEKERFFTIAFGVGIVAILFLFYRTASLSTALEKAELEVATNIEMSVKYEELQLENMNLQEKIFALTNPSGEVASDSEVVEGETPTENTDSAVSSDMGSITSYTVVKGDTGWSIAQKVYGNGSKYKEILAANNLKETDTIPVGAELTIPR